ncbi:NUDIX hydrolase [Clostridium beijerinckii]|uniref:ADP-ribose pyrophosphatase YjhB (NUDIX family) n=1 Tax=Clostridium beijerinckii TaxID=1520 RepID=A0AAX0AXY8_CLOBE|nr:NUDIX hydrolase [Clostridium beijerinckii]NRT71615.1 ADP-ribose pyrophosphatase YjhB (NUDIX family) [Clostridium beijerinckii]NRT87726.1 ADP-ribose pyrophosphatase YjhB (NUDIX family) [Clostridium beijerinckii]NYC73155.1 ADP-ribose pyrophosphatase YjhB (NUDIX family) [Clostridium beijerinckii]
MEWIDAVKDYNPCNEQEMKDKEIILKYSSIFDDILTRDNEIIHMTSSAFVINKARSKVLMVHHNIYNSWAWTGGHADGEKDLLSVAIKEAGEETGVKNLIPVNNEIASIDILPVFGHVKKGKFVSPHLHASLAYIIEADETEKLIVKPDENSAVKWIPIDEINLFSNEQHMKKVYDKIVFKIKNL